MVGIHKLTRHILVLSFFALIFMTSIFATQIQLAYASGKSPYELGYDHGASDAGDDCSDGCDWYILEPGKGFAFHTEEFNEGYIDGFCDNSPPGRGSDADEATFSCP